MSRKARVLAAIVAVGAVLAATQKLIFSEDEDKPGRASPVMQETEQSTDADRVISGWKKTPQEAARKMIEKYGQPDELTDRRLIWHKNGPWKKTEVVNEEIAHNFPKPHKDSLEQTIDYRVPADKYDELAQYDGSVIAERTKGELSARCDKEAMNFLALNLAADIVQGKKTVGEARKTHADQAAAAMENKPAPLTEKFQFRAPMGNTGDRDETVIGKK